MIFWVGKVRALLVILLLSLPSAAMHVDNLYFYITNDFLFQKNDLSEREEQFYKSFSLFSKYKKWSFGLTTRGHNFFKQDPRVTFKKPRLNVHKTFLQFNSRDFNLVAGDFYAMLGRGLTLSVLRNDAVLRERTVFGTDIRYNQKHLDLRAIWGIIKDERNEQKWIVWGGETQINTFKGNRIGFHLSYIDDIKPLRVLGKRLTASFSLSGSKLLKYISYYSEIATLDFIESDRERGFGLYTNITYSRSPLTLVFEYKRYRDFDNEINTPPVADREDELVFTMDTQGFRIYMQVVCFNPDITFFFNYGRYEELNTSGNHFYGGFYMEDLWDRLNISASYGIRDVLYPIQKLEAEMIFQFTNQLSVNITYKDKQYRDGNFKFIEQDLMLQLSVSPYFSFLLMYQYSHNKIAGLNHFFSSGIHVNFSDRMILELSGGTVRGGQVCSAGQCYVAPPFKGVKISISTTFK